MSGPARSVCATYLQPCYTNELTRQAAGRLPTLHGSARKVAPGPSPARLPTARCRRQADREGAGTSGRESHRGSVEAGKCPILALGEPVPDKGAQLTVYSPRGQAMLTWTAVSDNREPDAAQEQPEPLHRPPKGTGRGAEPVVVGKDGKEVGGLDPVQGIDRCRRVSPRLNTPY